MIRVAVAHSLEQMTNGVAEAPIGVGCLRCNLVWKLIRMHAEREGEARARSEDEDQNRDSSHLIDQCEASYRWLLACIVLHAYLNSSM